ncbi:MAG: hypothetical protein ABID54_05655 [Pseudomonadota bacterium]
MRRERIPWRLIRRYAWAAFLPSGLGLIGDGLRSQLHPDPGVHGRPDRVGGLGVVPLMEVDWLWYNLWNFFGGLAVKFYRQMKIYNRFSENQKMGQHIYSHFS